MVGEFDRRKEKWKTEMERERETRVREREFQKGRDREREKREGKLRERGGLGTGVTWAGPEIDREFTSLRSPVKPVLRFFPPTHKSTTTIIYTMHAAWR